MTYPEYHLDVLQNLVYIEKENAVLATFLDITKEESRQELIMRRSWIPSIWHRR